MEHHSVPVLCAGKGQISIYVLIAFNVLGSQGDRISVHYLGHEGKDSNSPHLHPFRGIGNDNPLQYSCLENPMDRGAWWATVRGVTKSQKRLSD